MLKILRFYKAYWRSISIAVIIFILTTIAVSDFKNIPETPFVGTDKIAHFGVFFILAIFLMVDVQKHTNLGLSKIIIIVLMICLVYGGMIELIQYWFIESRTGSLLDLLANNLGSLAACYIQSKFRLIRY